jgi:molybdopterin-guanine dinucleotide biosynthesis protein A
MPIPSNWKTAVLLADFPGQNPGTPFLEVYGETLLERTFHKARAFFDKIFIVASSLRIKSDLERKLSDADVILNLKNKGLLGDILAGLKACTSDYAFIGTCNMPFLNKKVLNHLFSNLNETQAVIPKFVNGQIEPLHSVYKTQPTIRALQDAIGDDKKEAINFIQNISQVNYLPVGELSDFDKKLETFFKVKSEQQFSIVKDRFKKKVYNKRLKKADHLCSGIIKENETNNTIYFKVPGTDETHDVTFNKRKNNWICDCKYYTMKACYCSHILAAQKCCGKESGGKND